MENFRTTFEIEKYNFSISHNSSVLSIGSCFSENISSFLYDNKFNIISNPTGILFNPVSIADLLERIFQKRYFSNNDIFSKNGEWKSFYHHSSFNKSSSKDFLSNANSKIENSHKILFEKFPTLILTLGTSFVYRLKERDSIVVANCQKEPSDKFSRELLTISDISNRLSTILKKYLSIDNMRVIITISPVRHLRDNYRENTISKSILHAAVFNLQSSLNIDYFPSYELLMDDLRDYRFYDSSLTHPSDLAKEYIINKFTKSLIADKSADFIKEYKPILNSKRHHIKTSSQNAIKRFAESNLQKIRNLKTKYSDIDFDNDIEHFKNLLKIHN